MSKMKREPLRQDTTPPKLNMREAPNWEEVDADVEDTPDRLSLPVGLLPEGLEAQWVTTSIYGQPMAQHRARFQKRGWTPVHQDDFDGQFDGVFMPKGAPGEITVDGMVLMVRPKQMSDKARARDRMRALEQVAIKEQALRHGDLPSVTLDSGHPSAVNSNRINKSFERISIPEE